MADQRIRHLDPGSCVLHLPSIPLMLPDTHVTAAFRIVQESLTNIARYAEATQVRSP
jgi:signal transduction histidine kinase